MENIFIDPTACIAGTVNIGKENYFGPFVQVEAQEGFRIQLADQDNLQDHVTIAAHQRDVFIGERTSIAHGALVVDARVGDFVFVGFNARVENAVLEDGVLVQHGATVIGVTIPENHIVPPGARITSQEQTQNLPVVKEGDLHFKDEVVEVNTEFASGYAQMVAELGEANVRGICPSPCTSWNSGFALPYLEKDVHLASGVRLIGDVRLGENCSVGENTSIRGDEGSPIIIGGKAKIGNQVTFHALKEQTIGIGEQMATGDRVVLHGALTIGNQVSIGDHAVVFKSTLGNHISVGQGAVVVGVNLADGSRVPDGALVLDQATADRLVS